MSIEKWDILRSDGTATGRQTVRGGNTLKAGEYHLVVHIWIVSSTGRFLIQRRAQSKKLMPGEWAATGGAAIAGEDSFAAAQRELFEELGIKGDQNTLKKLTRIKRRNSLVDVWVITTDTPENALVLQKSEVAEAHWVTRERLCEMIDEGMYHNYGKEYFNTVFSKIEDYLGVCV